MDRLTQVVRELWPRLVTGCLGLLWFLQLGGGPTLRLTNTAWVFSGDWRQHYLGWLFFRDEPWRFPVGSLSSLLYPVGTNIGFTDSNPLVSLLLKPVSHFLPSEVQFIGPWLAICFFLQGYMGAALASAVTRDKGQQILAGYLFVLTPVLMNRLGHDTLCAHWLILGLLYLCLRKYENAGGASRALWWSTAAVVFAAGVHPYLAAMCLALALALCARVAIDRLVPARRAVAAGVATIAAAAVVLWAIGYIGGGASSASSGFGEYASDLITFINPQLFSRVLPELPHTAGQGEGFAFLGLGGLLGLSVAAALLMRHRPALTRGMAVVIAVVALMGVYALSSRVSFAGTPMMALDGLYSPIATIAATFRASGRFIWPLHYLLLVMVLWAVTRTFGAMRPAAGTALLAVLVVLQVSDLRMDAWWSSPKNFRQAPAAELAPAVGRYKHLALYPMQVLGACTDPYEDDHVYRFMMLAYRLKLTFNSGTYARIDAPAVRRACEALDQRIAEGRTDPETIYVVKRESVERFRQFGAICRGFDGDWLCVDKNSDAEFREFMSR